MASQKVPLGLSTRTTCGRPIAAPVQIVLARQLVVIDVVVVADIERRIGKCQVDYAVAQSRQASDTIFVAHSIEVTFHLGCLARSEVQKKTRGPLGVIVSRQPKGSSGAAFSRIPGCAGFQRAVLRTAGEHLHVGRRLQRAWPCVWPQSTVSR